jgi:hypothetical protein
MRTDDEFGPKDALAFVLLLDVQQGKELSQDDWEWLYDHTTKNKPATLEDFKQRLLTMLRP